MHQTLKTSMYYGTVIISCCVRFMCISINFPFLNSVTPKNRSVYWPQTKKRAAKGQKPPLQKQCYIICVCCTQQIKLMLFFPLRWLYLKSTARHLLQFMFGLFIFSLYIWHCWAFYSSEGKRVLKGKGNKMKITLIKKNKALIHHITLTVTHFTVAGCLS